MNDFVDGGPKRGSITLKNMSKRTVSDLIISLKHPDIANSDLPGFKKLIIEGTKGVKVDDNYDGTIDNNEDDNSDSTPEHQIRVVFDEVSRENSITIYYHLTKYVPPGTKITYRWSVGNELVHYDVVPPFNAGTPGEFATIEIPGSTQRGSFLIQNESMNYLASVIIPPGEFFFDNFQLEPPYEESEIATYTGEVMVHFIPPIPPYDYAVVNFSLFEPTPEVPLPMDMITLDAFPFDCYMELEGLAISECTDVNLFTVDVNVAFNPGLRYCKEFTFTNGLDVSASDLHVTYTGTGGSLETILVENAPGCNPPAIPSNGAITNTMELIWDSACVDPGESVKVKVCTQNGPLAFAGGHWTLNNVDIGEINQEDVAHGPESSTNKGKFKVEANTITGELTMHEGWATGQLTLPADGTDRDLLAYFTGDVDCGLEIGDAINSPLCNNDPILASCDEIEGDPSDFPVGEYPWERYAPGQVIQKHTPDNPIASIKVVPPQMLNEEDKYQCGDDYIVTKSTQNFPIATAAFQFFRPGTYFVEIIYEDGTVERRICVVDERCVNDLGIGGKCYGGPVREFPCGTPDIAVVSSTLGFPHVYGDVGKIADNIDDAAKLICQKYEDAGGEEPIDVVLNGHGGPGYIIIGSERLDILYC